MNATTPHPAGPDRDKAVQLLRDLGLTRTEAEVYFTALQTCSTEPVSSYKLAQVMGRDPANVAKTLSALMRVGAINVVQDKPRLYLPIEPAKFTEQVLTRVQNNSQEAVELLRHFQPPEPAGVTLGLAGTDQVLTKARELLASCQSRVQIFGSKECLRELGGDLEELGERPDCEVRVLSPLDMISDSVDITVFSPVSDLAKLMTGDFLMLVVDDQAWLSATIDGEKNQNSAGWWANHSPIAAVLGGALNLAWQAGRTAQTAPMTAPEAPVSPAPEPPPAEPTAPVAVAVVEEAETEAEAEAKTEAEDFEEGLTFLMRHEDRQHKKKGEQ